MRHFLVHMVVLTTQRFNLAPSDLQFLRSLLHLHLSFTSLLASTFEISDMVGC